MDLEETTQTEETETTTTETQQVQIEGSKVFTQDEVNKLIAKEKSKVKSQFKDYDTLKQENETLKAKTEELATSAKTAEQKLIEEKTHQSITKGVEEFHLPDAKLAIKLLDKTKFQYAEDGSVSNIKSLVTALLEEHPTLSKKATPANVVESSSGTEQQKYTLQPNYNSNFFKGGGVKQIIESTLFNGT